jgi:ferredoxin-NADP reductase
VLEVALVLGLGLLLGGLQAWWRFGGRAAGSPAPAHLQLRVTAVTRETARAVSLELEPALPFRAGQFLNVRRGPGEPWRSYSLSRAPGEPLRLTIQLKPGGRVSPRLHALQPGATLEARGPYGAFVADDLEGPLLFIAGGSGITPLLSMLRAGVTADLIYASRSPADTLLLDEVRACVPPDRLVLVWEQDAAPEGVSGRLDAPTLRTCLSRLRGGWRAAMICGPAPMREVARTVLQADLPGLPVREERFSHGVIAGEAAYATFMSDAGPVAFPVAADESLLQAARRAGLDLPSGCEVGSCGTCRVRVLSGSVTCDGLSAAEREAGLALACVGRCAGLVTFEREA